MAKFWFKLHLLLGLSAGSLLVIIGLSGALLAAQQPLLRWLNPEILTVTPQPGGPLSPPALLRQALPQLPTAPLLSLNLSGDPAQSASITLANGRRGKRGQNYYFNPYSGALLGASLRGEPSLIWVEKLHRHLTLGPWGHLVTGLCALALVLLLISGFWLRWPPQPGQWRSWFYLNLRLSGPRRWGQLHAVVATWLLPCYLLIAASGLYWSYGWLSDGRLLGDGRPHSGQIAPASGQGPNTTLGANSGGGRNSGTGFGIGNGSGSGNGSGRRSGLGQGASGPSGAPLAVADLAAIWDSTSTLLATTDSGWRQLSLSLKADANGQVTLYYVAADAPHRDAFSRIRLDLSSGQLIDHRPYASMPLGQRLSASMMALHSGHYWGVIGQSLFFIASLLLPLFAITGWYLYLSRRRQD